MANALDGFVFSDSSADLFTAAADASAESATVTWDTGIGLFTALVDGLHAYDCMSIRALIGSATYAKFASTFRGTDGERSLYDYLSEKLGGLRVSNRVPAKASNAQKALAVLDAGGQPIRVPVWESMRFIVNPYSGAGEGETTVTALSLVGDPVVPYGQSQVKEVHPRIS